MRVARMREKKKEREIANTPIFPRVWLTSCQHVFYLLDVFQDISSPSVPRYARVCVHERTRTYRHTHTHTFDIPEVSRSWLPEKRGPACLILVSLPVKVLRASSSHRQAIRPRLSHRYSRGLLGARGKMRQVVVRSRSPGTREIRLLLSPPPARSFGSAIHSCRVYYLRVCRSRVWATRRGARGPRGRFAAEAGT